MQVLSEKRMELSQTIASLSGSIRMEKGCNRCDFCQSIEDENRLSLLEEWDTQENLESHLKSGRFRVLRGAMSLLKEPYEITFHTVSHPEGMEDDLMDELLLRNVFAARGAVIYDKFYGPHEQL
jgi:quinol monooxygenase YgiN